MNFNGFIRLFHAFLQVMEETDEHEPDEER